LLPNRLTAKSLRRLGLESHGRTGLLTPMGWVVTGEAPRKAGVYDPYIIIAFLWFNFSDFYTRSSRPQPGRQTPYQHMTSDSPGELLHRAREFECSTSFLHNLIFILSFILFVVIGLPGATCGDFSTAEHAADRVLQYTRRGD
jgi:hypothetical protein